ncbi:GTPase activating protein (GAP) for Rho1p [Tilletia horrida]|nr:GTPase activating protein (GAP) for Rho1p [Tilletia horrida]
MASSSTGPGSNLSTVPSNPGASGISIQSSSAAIGARSTSSGGADDDGEPTKQSLKAWWSSFTSGRKDKDTSILGSSPSNTSAAAAATASAAAVTAGMGKPGGVFGVPLRTSLKYASVAISMAAEDGKEYVWGYVPVVVAKVGLFLKENATQVEGVFRIAGSQKRMKELQDTFDSPPRYGKSVDWSKYSVHDAASVLRRYLNHMPEPIVPLNLYSEFKNVMIKQPFDVDAAIRTYKLLITSMPHANQYLLLYVLDLLAVFARESEKNLMPPSNLAVIFQPGIFSHPSHLQNPAEHKVAVEALEFLITHQDSFVLGLSPPPPPNIRPEDLTGVSKPLSPIPASESGIRAEDVLIPSDSDEEQDTTAFVAHRGGGAERAAAAAAAAAATGASADTSGKSGRRSGGGQSSGTNLVRSLSASAKAPRRLFGGRKSTVAATSTAPGGGGGGNEMQIGSPTLVGHVGMEALSSPLPNPAGAKAAAEAAAHRGTGSSKLAPTSVPMGLSRSAGPTAQSPRAPEPAPEAQASTSPAPTGNIHETGLGSRSPNKALSEAPIPAGPPAVISPPSTPPGTVNVKRSKTTPNRRKTGDVSSGSSTSEGKADRSITSGGGVPGETPITPPSSKLLGSPRKGQQ